MTNHRSRSHADTGSHSESPGATTGEGWTLQAVGVTELEEQLYEILLVHPGAILADLIAFSNFSRRKVQLVLEALELKGMASHSPERHHRYFPTPPDVAIETLIAKRTEAFQRVRVVASRLQEKAHGAHDSQNPDERVVEIIMGQEPQLEVFKQIQCAAQKELIGFDRLPHVMSVVNQVQFDVMDRGVQYRGIYDRSILELPDAAEHIWAYMKGGEEARVYHTVPLKLIAADHRIALLPLESQQLSGAILLVRSSSLLDALYELFELIWERAAPILLTSSGMLEAGEEESSIASKVEHLIPLLAAGLNDKAIAAQLGISHRTLDRYMREFMQSMDARTRFQAGWIAAHRFSRPIQ
ncbi:MAG: helix-turn-helix domain-containing protein [Gammaproteobacteria bacterium]